MLLADPFKPIRRGKNRGKYRSPSGRIFSHKQVRRYYARGGTFDDFWCDAVKPNADPTGTGDIRRRWAGVTEIKLRRVRAALQKAVMQQDVLGLKPGSTSPLALAGSTGSREIGFQTWLDNMLKNVVVEDGRWQRTFIAAAYNRGVARAMRLTGSNAKPDDMTETIESLTTLALTELQGIMEAFSQRALRVASLAWLHNDLPPETMKEMELALKSVATVRTRALVETLTVKAFNTGTLDQFEAAGKSHVGVIPETIRTGRTNDQRIIDAPRRTGPGSRIGREEPPSRSTVGRIRRVERIFERIQEVNVETAGDDKVCEICEDIEANNPYTIDEARSLIPAHINCRCTFVPLDGGDDFDELDEDAATIVIIDSDERIYEGGWFLGTLDEWNEEDHPRDPDGRFASGEGISSSLEAPTIPVASSNEGDDEKINKDVSRMGLVELFEHAKVLRAEGRKNLTSHQRSALHQKLTELHKRQHELYTAKGNTKAAEGARRQLEKMGVKTGGGGPTPLPIPTPKPVGADVQGAKTPRELKSAFRSKHGIDIDWHAPDKWVEDKLMAKAKHTDKLLDDLHERFPGIKENMSLDKIQLDPGYHTKEHRDALGFYSYRERRLVMAADLPRGSNSGRNGDWSVAGNKYDSTFRHEMGHAIDRRLSQRDRDQYVAEKKYMVPDPTNEAWKENKSNASNLTRYGMTNRAEYFAESFAAYTDPRYGKDDPSFRFKTSWRMERLFDRHLHKKG